MELDLLVNLGISNILFLLALFTDVEPLQNSFDLEEHYCRALLCRLRFRKVLTSVFYWSIFLWIAILHITLINACLSMRLTFEMFTW